LGRLLAGAASSRRAAIGEGLHPDRGELVVAHAQLLARVDAPARAAQPLAVEDDGLGSFGGDARAPERSSASR
jgi:hypothetical protein